MAGVLDQEEIDALMGGLDSGALDTAAEQPQGPTQNFNFSKQHYALRRLLPALEGVNNQFADAALDKLARISPSIETVSAAPIAVTSLQELNPRLATPCRIATVAAAPLTTPIYLIVDSDLVFDMVNRYFGGGNSLRKSRSSERFSTTELRLSEQIGEELLAELKPAWHSLIDIQVEIGNWENDTRFIDDLEDDETLLATRFVVSFGESEGSIWLVIPWKGIEPVRDRFGGAAKHGKREHDPEWDKKLRKGLEETELELVAILAQSRVKLKRALQLKKGDVIAINEPAEISLSIDGIPLMRASFGTHDGKIAAKIIETTRTPLLAGK